MALRFALIILLFLFGNAFAQVPFVQEDAPSSVADLESLYPLKPPDLSSPQATLKSFLRNANEGISYWYSEESGDALDRAVRRAMLCLDLSDIPTATRNAIGKEKILLLKEILDRVEVPPFEEIPDAEEIGRSGLTDWTIPNTELTISQLTEGPRAGAFVFSADTVALLERFYQLAEALPYKRGATIGVYEDFLYGPGPLVPRAWLVGLPSWSYVVIGEQTIWQWIGLALLIVFAALVTVLFYRAAKRWDERFSETGAWMQFGKPMTAVFTVLIMQVMSILIDDAINITGTAFIVIEFLISILSFLAIAWLAALIVTWVGEGIIIARHLHTASLKTQLIRITTRLISIVVVAYVGVIAAESIGIPVAPLIAGLGVGGLAIALAVRPTLENIVGGFILFADRPVRVGDFCSFEDKMGTVEQIGLRSTRVRGLDRTLISIPNAVFANMQIINWGSCDRMLIDKTIGLRCETKPEQLRYVLAQLREMFLAHPAIHQDTARIRFVGYGDSSQDIQIRVYAETRDWNEFFAIQEDVLLRIGEIVEESGTRFAFPSQTVYYGRDQGIDQERSADAMRQVEAWRATQQLPFPRMPSSRRKEISKTLDYPPSGSPEARRSESRPPERAEPLSAPVGKEPE